MRGRFSLRFLLEYLLDFGAGPYDGTCSRSGSAVLRYCGTAVVGEDAVWAVRPIATGSVTDRRWLKESARLARLVAKLGTYRT